MTTLAIIIGLTAIAALAWRRASLRRRMAKHVERMMER
jgi:hypothetical protein